MKGFRRCPNGHFYKEDLTECPHCSHGASSNQDATKMNTMESTNKDFDKTQVFSSQDKTKAYTEEKTKVFGSGSKKAAKPRDLDKTYIAGVTDAGDDASVEATPRSQRKIVGWLVSFTLDPLGIDYRIYEGSNSIGKSPSNTITITSDHTISSEHVNILFRRGDFYIKDKMTTNGTYLNGEDMEVERAYKLNDGDEVKMGDTLFIFKTWH